MSFEVGKKALDFLIANSGSRKNLEVDFFGGEPLMTGRLSKTWWHTEESRRNSIIKNSVLH